MPLERVRFEILQEAEVSQGRPRGDLRKKNPTGNPARGVHRHEPKGPAPQVAAGLPSGEGRPDGEADDIAAQDEEEEDRHSPEVEPPEPARGRIGRVEPQHGRGHVRVKDQARADPAQSLEGQVAGPLPGGPRGGEPFRPPSRHGRPSRMGSFVGNGDSTAWGLINKPPAGESTTNSKRARRTSRPARAPGPRCYGRSLRT